MQIRVVLAIFKLKLNMRTTNNIHHFLSMHTEDSFLLLQDALRHTIATSKNGKTNLVVSVEAFGNTDTERRDNLVFMNAMILSDEAKWQEFVESTIREQPEALWFNVLVPQELREQRSNFQRVRLNHIGPSDDYVQQSPLPDLDQLTHTQELMACTKLQDVNLKEHKEATLDVTRKLIEAGAKIIQVGNRSMIEQLGNSTCTSNDTLHIVITGSNHLGIGHEIKANRHFAVLPKAFLEMLPKGFRNFNFYNLIITNMKALKSVNGGEITDFDLKQAYLQDRLNGYLSWLKQEYGDNFPPDKTFLDSVEVISLLSSAWILRTDKEKINELFDKCFERRPNSEDRTTYYLSMLTIGEWFDTEIAPHHESLQLPDLLHLMFKKLTTTAK